MLMYRYDLHALRAGRQRAVGPEGPPGLRRLPPLARVAGQPGGHRHAALASTRPSGRTRRWSPAATRARCRSPACRRLRDATHGPSRRSAWRSIARGVRAGGKVAPVSDANPSLAIEAEAISYAYPDGIEALDGLDLPRRAGRVRGRDGGQRRGQDHADEGAHAAGPPAAGAGPPGRAPTSPACGRPNSIAASAWCFRTRPINCSPPRSSRTWPSGRATWAWPRPKWPERVEEALAAVDALALRGRPIHHLSFGEQKRVCLAGVLAMRPAILVLDEPTAGLDPAGEAQMIELLAAAQPAGEHHAHRLHAFGRPAAGAGRSRSTCSARAACSGKGRRRSLGRSRAAAEAGLRLPLVAQLFHELDAATACRPTAAAEHRAGPAANPAMDRQTRHIVGAGQGENGDVKLCAAASPPAPARRRRPRRRPWSSPAAPSPAEVEVLVCPRGAGDPRARRLPAASRPAAGCRRGRRAQGRRRRPRRDRRPGDRAPRLAWSRRRGRDALPPAKAWARSPSRGCRCRPASRPSIPCRGR